ncbi:MAG: hypothetical protein QM523_03910 [Candidatus Pacebacteria bacterium]|nr:hypothetical protein [Candidatus Paceibacterota bacterium]
MKLNHITLKSNYPKDEFGRVVFGKDEIAKVELSASNFFNRPSPSNAPMVLDSDAPLGDYSYLLDEGQEQKDQK